MCTFKKEMDHTTFVDFDQLNNWIKTIESQNATDVFVDGFNNREVI